MNEINDIEAIGNFMRAGKAIFTIENEETGNRFTYKVAAPKDNENDVRFVSVLSGPDNTSNYSYMGLLTTSGFRSTRNSKVGSEAISYKAFQWLNSMVVGRLPLPESVKVRHEGRCGRCGRKLTTPESIDAGYGPECIGKLNF